MSSVQVDTSKLDALIAKTPGKLTDVLMQTAFRILSDARQVTPRDPARPPQDLSQPVSGALRANSDVVKISSSQVNVEYYQEYAVWQEVGAPSINLPARPFLTPAVEKAASQFEKDLAKVIEP